MKKIAVVNRTNFMNFGSVLQCYALCQAIRNLGYESEIVWCKGGLSKNFDIRPRKLLVSLLRSLCRPYLLGEILGNAKFVSSQHYPQEMEQLFANFVRAHIPQKKYTWRELCHLANQSETYSAFVCGSDQIWCSTSLYVDPMLYLRFAPQNRRIAYAPSLGRDYIPGYNRRCMKRYISEIPTLSIREDVGQHLVKELTGRVAQLVLDPTLLLSVEEWQKLARSITLPEKYILCYFLNTPSEEVQRSIASFADRYKYKIVILGCQLPIFTAEQSFYPLCGPAEFLSAVSRSEQVFTDSYHGMLFSIIYQRNFWSFPRNYQKYSQASRQISLLNMLNLSERYSDQFGTKDPAPIDYTLVWQHLKNNQKSSLLFLKEALASNE